MNMPIIKSQKILCLCCMEEHEVKTVFVDEEQIQANYTKMKESYRVKINSRKI